MKMYLYLNKKYTTIDPAELRKQHLHIVTAFLRRKDVPAWFRGCSEFQWKAVDSLQNAIRDDYEQGTAHRVRDCLSILGITPMVSNSDLKLVMSLSNGNDLAFLWFLMELFYKTPIEGHYSLNEQLILSSITHLDMITTLRGLDRVLPPGHPSMLQLKKRERLREEQALLQQQGKVKIKKNKESPYFEKLPNPIQISTRSLLSERPDLSANLFQYEMYRDPNYVPPNERNRWFAEINNPNAEVREHLDVIFKKFEIPKHFRREVDYIVNMALDRMDDFKNAAPMKCLRHQQKEEAERRLKSEKYKEMLTKLCALIKTKEQRQPLISEMLERDIATYELLLRKQRESCGTKSVVRVLAKDRLCEFFVRDSEDEPIERTSELMLNGELLKRTPMPFSDKHHQYRGQRILERYCEKYNYGHVDPKTPSTSMCFFEAPKAHKPFMFDYPKIFSTEEKNNSTINIKRKIVKALSVSNTRMEPEMLSNAVDKCYEKMLAQYKEEEERKLAEEERTNNGSKNGKQEAQKQGTVIKTTKDVTKKSKRAAHTSVEAKSKDQQKSSHTSNSPVTALLINSQQRLSPQIPRNAKLTKKLTNNNTNKHMHIELASNKRLSHNKILKQAAVQDLRAARCTWKSKENTWMNLRKFDKTQLNTQPTEIDDNLPSKMPRLPFYDCEDRELMHNMLKIALKHLAKDPKYVLAGLPECYKLPLLREWIYRRYGKRYSKAQRLESYETSVDICNAIDQLKSKVPLPTSKEIAESEVQSYRCREYKMQKVKKVQNHYAETLNAQLMRETRTFWLAMRSTLCDTSPRNMFFSYYPSRLADIKRFRTWKPFEFNNVHKEWQKRQRERNRKQ